MFFVKGFGFKYKKRWIELVGAMVLFCFYQTTKAQVATYSFSESSAVYTALSSPSVAYTAPWDDHTPGSAFQATLGFDFVYDGITQTQCFISPNGYISFGVQPTANNYLPLSVATVFTNGGTISALGLDLIATTDNITFQTIGSAPNRTFVVQWSNVRRKSKTGNFNFQIRLNETSNTIEFSYGLCAPDDVTALNAQVGIRGASNNFPQRDVLNRLQTGVNTNAAWLGKTTNGTANSSTVRTSVTEYPNNGLKYTYTPSLPCTSPTAGPLSLVIGNTNVTSTSFVGNSFTAASPAPTNYLILRSLSNTPPTVTDLPNRTYWAVSNVISGIYTVLSVTNVTAFTQTGLMPNTTYYYWVIPYNAGCLGGPYYNLGAMISASKTTCISAPSGLAASTVEGNSFTASWTAVTGATDYLLDVSTNSTFTALLPSFSGVSTSGSTNFVVSGLSSLTTYYFRVRAVGITCNANSATATCTTICGAYNIPYFQNFDTTALNSIPSCFTIVDNNSDSNSWSTQNVQPASNPNALHLVTSTTTDSDDWFFTPGLNLTAGVTYRLRFKYNTQSAGIYSENLRVRLGTGASESNMNNTILDLSNLQNTVYQTTTVDFTPVANNVYYVGFQGYSFANQSKILIDDISIIVSPTCYEPNDLSIVSVNSNSAVIAWSASVPEPTDGYEVYVSTSNITPGFSVTPNATVGFGVTTATVSGLAPATLYYVWVRGNCSSSDKSIWSNIQTFSTDCASALPLIVTAGTLCGGGSASLQAIGSPGSIIEWYADSTGTTLLSTGSTFVTPTLSATTVYYAQSKAPGGLVSLGPISPSLQGGSLGSQTAQTLIGFSVISATTLQSFDIYPMTAGQNGTIEIRNSVNVIVATYTYITNAAGGNTPQTIPLALDLAIGNYFLYFETLPASGLIGNIDNASYPYNSSIANINGNDYDNTFFFYAYNWKLSNICRSLFTPVTATVIASPVISFSGTSSTICKGESVGLITLTGADSYDTFAWNTTVGLSGNIATGFNFSPLITTNYILTASQSTGSLCSSVIAYTVVVKPDPPAIAIVPATVSLCEGAIQTLNANLDLSTQAVIFSENFNAPTNSWNKINASVGGIVTNAAWTLRPSPYPYSSSYWNITMNSNDVSQFYLTNSDAQGSPGTNRTLTYLESPSINLSGYTSATLSFFHFLRYIPGNKARVEVSSDGGSSWTIIGNYLSNQGSSSSFTNATISMNAYVGLANVKIRFLYDATWDFGWAIDNVSITGNLAVEVTWNPPTALFFDAAATIPYIADTPTGTIYTKPTETTIYTGSVVGSNGCSASSSTNITVIPTPIAGLLSDSQSVCATWQATDLVLTGFSGGNIVRWEYANDSAFTIGLTSIANTNSILTTNEIGTFPGTRFYRVVIQNGTCPVVYSNFVSINYASTRWDGVSWSDGLPNSNTKVIFDCGASTFSSTGDIEACSIEVLSGNVVINSNHTLHVQNDVKILGGTLTFENDASLVQVNSLNNLGLPFSNTGSITYKRISTPIKRLDYVYWSSPVFPQTLLSFSPSTALFFYYNPLITNWAYATTNVPMIPGKGYLVRAPDVSPFNLTTPNNFNGAFVGVPNTGDISLPIIGNANQFNLIGNPYPSALSADAFLSDATNTPLIDATIYLWTHNTPITNNVYNASDYAMYNYAGGVGTGSQAINPGLNTNIPNGKIASGQGFFVKGLSSGNIVFKNSMRLTGNNDQFFRMTNQTSQNTVDLERHRFWLDVYNNQGAFKQTLVAYIQNATNAGMDRGFDGEMIDMGNVVMLYIPQEGKKLSIQGRALPFNQTDVVPLGFKSTVAGVYKIRLSNFDGLFNSQNIYLEDTQMNITHDLRSGDYEFSTPAGTFDDRFRIKFETGTLSVGNYDLSSNEVVIFKNSEQSFVVNTGQFTIDSVKVFDVRGRLLDELNEINANQTIINVGLSNELILIQLKLQNGQIITKKVVK